jgi:hypothetical protein
MSNTRLVSDMIQIEEPQHHKQQQEDFAAKKAHQGKRVLQCDIHHRVFFFFFFCSGSVTTFKIEKTFQFLFLNRIQKKKCHSFHFFSLISRLPFLLYILNNYSNII